MKKIAIFLISMFLIGFILLSGCNTTTPEPHNGNTDIVGDNDSDGYLDNQDDYPTDPNFHKKEYLCSRPGTITLEEGKGQGFGCNITSDWKVIDVTWRVDSPTNLSDERQHNITFEVTIPPDTTGSITSSYFYDEIANRNLRFTIDNSNWGAWRFNFHYHSSPNVREPVTISYDIYMIQ